MSYIDIFENFIASQPAINDFINFKKYDNYYHIEFRVDQKSCSVHIYSDHLFSESLNLKTKGQSFWDDLDEVKEAYKLQLDESRFE